MKRWPNGGWALRSKEQEEDGTIGGAERDVHLEKDVNGFQLFGNLRSNLTEFRKHLNILGCS